MSEHPELARLVRLVQQRHALAVDQAFRMCERRGHSFSDLVVLYPKDSTDVVIETKSGEKVLTLAAPRVVKQNTKNQEEK